MFPKFFWGWAKSGKSFFFPLETKKPTFLLKFSKSKRGFGPYLPLSDAHVPVFPKVWIKTKEELRMAKN